MEHKVYNRQLQKTLMANRVVDRVQQQRVFESANLNEMFVYTRAPPVAPTALKESAAMACDSVLAEIAEGSSAAWLASIPAEHDCFFEAQEAEELTQAEQDAAQLQ